MTAAKTGASDAPSSTPRVMHGWTLYDIQDRARATAVLLCSDAGTTGAQQAIRQHRHTWGYRSRDGADCAGAAPRFAHYWTNRDRAPYTETFLDTLALKQVREVLAEPDRDVLTALAVDDTDNGRGRRPERGVSWKPIVPAT